MIRNVPYRFLLVLPLGLAALAADSHSLPVEPPGTPAARDFPIMAWGDTTADPQQLRWMKEAGFNITGFCSPAELAATSAAGLACFVDDARERVPLAHAPIPTGDKEESRKSCARNRIQSGRYRSLPPR